MCLLKDELSENADPHTSQENGFSAVWVRLWILQDDLLKNAATQTSQENGFTPVCFRLWI